MVYRLLAAVLIHNSNSHSVVVSCRWLLIVAYEGYSVLWLHFGDVRQFVDCRRKTLEKIKQRTRVCLNVDGLSAQTQTFKHKRSDLFHRTDRQYIYISDPEHTSPEPYRRESISRYKDDDTPISTLTIKKRKEYPTRTDERLRQ